MRHNCTVIQIQLFYWCYYCLIPRTKPPRNTLETADCARSHGPPPVAAATVIFLNNANLSGFHTLCNSHMAKALHLFQQQPTELLVQSCFWNFLTCTEEPRKHAPHFVDKNPTPPKETALIGETFPGRQENLTSAEQCYVP